MITGIDENRNSTVWRKTVSHVIATAAGREVPLDDAFRLGRFVDGRKRPILVKLQSVWDRRLVLNGGRKLAEVVEFRRRVFVTADEPPDVRRRSTMTRLKTRAESQGKCVSVCITRAFFPIDGVDTFCLTRGFM